MIAKWYSQEGLSYVDIREKIFEWGNQYHVFIDCNVNSVITQALKDTKPLRSDSNIKISESDVYTIIKLFDKKSTRLVALAMLCYAKAFAEKNGEFVLSVSALANWIGMSNSNISDRILPELINFGYIEKVERKDTTFTWNKTVKIKASRFKMLVPVFNSGKYYLHDNNITELYDIIFSNRKSYSDMIGQV